MYNKYAYLIPKGHIAILWSNLRKWLDELERFPGRLSVERSGRMRCLDLKVAVRVNLEPGEGYARKDRATIISRGIADATARLLSHSDEGLINASVYRIEETHTQVAVCMCPDLMTECEVRTIVEKELNKTFSVSGAKVESCREITVKKHLALEGEADSLSISHMSRRLPRKVRLDYFNNCYYRISESVIDDVILSKNQAKNEAAAMMADRSLFEEIERIYDPINEAIFYGHPVHYRIKAGDRESSKVIINLIVRMLKSRGRIPGDRISHIYDIAEECYNEEDLNCAIKNAQSTAVAIELSGTKGDHGNYASSYDAVVRSFAGLIEKYHHNTLFFFVENKDEPGFSPDLIGHVSDYLDIVDIEEGMGSLEESARVLRTMIESSPYKQLVSEGFDDYLPKKRSVVTYHDVNVAFEKWKRNVLKEKAYRSYQKCRTLELKKEKESVSAYEKLQSMIGLTEVKRVTDQIISSYKLQELRKSYRMDDETISRHMIFTGNPGSAKTSVARLLADILTEEHILKTGCLVECGRQDLVGKYVGWTAKEVEAKFRKAKGGILFIDEAYSLVDDRDGSFGDEAINTIVQQMENNRDDVIVIFAGYADRMESFLQANEGLRSRIAFHLDFPDYTAEELWQIMELMVQERDYEMANGVYEKCMSVFNKACAMDGFGNGRFVRNYLDQVILRQAERLMPPGEKTKRPSKKKCRELIAEDFGVDFSAFFEKDVKRKPIGFFA